MVKPIDFHVHFFPESIAGKVVDFLAAHYNIPVNYRGLKEEYLQLARAASIRAAVFSTAATRPHQVKAANNWAIANKGNGLVPFGTLHPYAGDAEIDAELARLRAAGIRGIKLHPDFQCFNLDEDRAMSLYERLVPDLILLTHVGDDEVSHKINHATPEQLSRVLDLFPGLTVVAAHMGGYQMWRRAMDALVGKDVFFDTSSTLDFLPDKDFVQMIREHGVHKILFGSDYPFRDPGWEVCRLSKVRLGADDLEAILYHNGRRLLARIGL
ncbi:MAG: amidohydrolase family protein [Bacillota bacterium]